MIDIGILTYMQFNNIIILTHLQSFNLIIKEQLIDLNTSTYVCST